MDLQFCRSNSYLLSRRSEKIAVDVIQLPTEGKEYVDFSFPAPPAGIGAKDKEEFESRLSKEEEVMTSLRDESFSIMTICGMGGAGKKLFGNIFVKSRKLEHYLKRSIDFVLAESR